MTITNGYATLAEFRARLDGSGSVTWTEEDDAMHETAIEAASRWVDKYTGRRFYESAEQARYYEPEFGHTATVDDLLSVTTIETDDGANGTYTAWTASDFDLAPYNAPAHDEPYSYIEVANGGTKGLPVDTRKGLKVTGVWGYCTAANRPEDIKQAAILIALRLWKRKDAIFGVAGAPALGVTIVQAKIEADGDVMALLDPYKRAYF